VASARLGAAPREKSENSLMIQRGAADANANGDEARRNRVMANEDE
jgi:hypothetical protein